MLVAGDAPEREGVGIRWRVGVRVELDHAVMVGEPDRMRVPRVQVWIFQQAQAPALGGLWSAATAQPVAAVVGRSEEHTSELQSLMRRSYAVFGLKKDENQDNKDHNNQVLLSN